MKAILVIDIPNELDVNDLLIDYCVHTKGEYNPIRKGGNHSLKQMPKKKIVLEHHTGSCIANVIEMTEAHGYNECIKEMLGERF
jgi:hypothetical protein